LSDFESGVEGSKVKWTLKSALVGHLHRLVLRLGIVDGSSFTRIGNSSSASGVRRSSEVAGASEKTGESDSSDFSSRESSSFERRDLDCESQDCGTVGLPFAEFFF